jgi:hypothetical protein
MNNRFVWCGAVYADGNVPRFRRYILCLSSEWKEFVEQAADKKHIAVRGRYRLSEEIFCLVSKLKELRGF